MVRINQSTVTDNQQSQRNEANHQQCEKSRNINRIVGKEWGYSNASNRTTQQQCFADLLIEFHSQRLQKIPPEMPKGDPRRGRL